MSGAKAAPGEKGREVRREHPLRFLRGRAAVMGWLSTREPTTDDETTVQLATGWMGRWSVKNPEPEDLPSAAEMVLALRALGMERCCVPGLLGFT